jgi:hypothetical protein
LSVNGSKAFVVTGRDTNATWRSLSTLCHERDWSKPRALFELQNGLRYRTVPPGHTIDWHNPNVERSLAAEPRVTDFFRYPPSLQPNSTPAD